MRESRILMLVPHEPDLDPRIGWVLDLCRNLGRTEVISATWNSTKPPIEYDGTVSIERIDYATTASRRAKAIAKATARLGACGPARRFSERTGRLPASASLRGRVDHHVGAALRLASAWGFYGLLLSALYQRGRATLAPPVLIISHDIYGLMPAALLKRRFQTRLLHDSHEFFPEADLLAPRWQKRLTAALERPFIRRADRVVTVSPPLASVFEQTYRIRNVRAVPNAEPRVALAPRSARATGPVRFLLQGQASPGRGFEALFELWEAIDDPRAILQVRCPDGEYPQKLRRRTAALVEAGRLEWLDAVAGSELVRAAASADVGVIPYVGPSLNHLYASPNKFSQYMCAGLAVLSCSDLKYVSELVRRYDCGTTYDPGSAESLRQAVDVLAGDPARLRGLQTNSQIAVSEHYNWESCSAPFRDAIRELLA